MLLEQDHRIYWTQHTFPDDTDEGADIHGGLGSIVKTVNVVLTPDSDGDGVVNLIDLDDDNDGILDVDEGTGDIDGDGIPNNLDIDADGDEVYDIHEAGHSELDGDGDGDIDGVPADFGANGLYFNIESDDSPAASVTYVILDSDGDTIINVLDINDDGDNVNTIFENNNADGDGNPATGSSSRYDGDTILNYLDMDDDGMVF